MLTPQLPQNEGDLIERIFKYYKTKITVNSQKMHFH